MNKEMIIEKYNNVFDEEGNIKVCGRFKCIELINALSEAFPNVDFGSQKTGFMEVKTIKEYITKL